MANMQDAPPPSGMAEYLIPIWDEMKGQVRAAIGTAGLESLCLQIHRMRDAQSRVAKDGPIVLDGKGVASQHPALAIEKSASAEIRTWLREFGCSR